MMFDIVICYGPNDENIIDLMIEYTKKNIIGYRNIYIISYDKNIKINGCIIIDEKIFPFTKEYISKNINLKYRSGWYLQQLLKLYAVFIIDNILDNILIIDADSLFIKPTLFFENGIPFYNYSDEYHKPYFHHITLLHTTLEKMDKNKSGIAHHMIMQKNILENLFKLIEDYHKIPFYKVFIENITKDINIESGASEYELYFNYLLKYVHNDYYKIRKLNFLNTNRNFIISNNILNKLIESNVNYISLHHWM